MVRFGRKIHFRADLRRSKKKIERSIVGSTSVGSVVQRGSLVFVDDAKGHRLTSLPAGKGSKDGLQGHTSSTVSLRRGLLIDTYDERGQRLSSTLAGR